MIAKRLVLVTGLIVITILGSFSLPKKTFGIAPSPDKSQLLYVQEGDLWMADLSGANPVQLADGAPFDLWGENVGHDSFHAPYILPAQQVAYMSWADDRLRFAAWGTNSTTLPPIETDIEKTFGIAVSPEGDRIAVIAAGGQELQIFSLETGELLQTWPFTFERGTGGGPYLPDDFLYYMQSGFLGNHLLFAWVENSVLVSKTPKAVGVEAINLSTGAVTTLSETLYRSVISPDGQLLAGIDPTGENPRLVVIDWANQVEVASYSDKDVAGYDQLTWTPTGDLIFTTVQERNLIPLRPQNEEVALRMLFNALPMRIPLYTVALYSFEVSTSTAQVLWSSDQWRGIPTLTASEDAVYFSVITNLEPLITALNAGQSEAEIMAQVPHSDLYRLVLTEEVGPELLIPGGESPSLATGLR